MLWDSTRGRLIASETTTIMTAGCGHDWAVRLRDGVTMAQRSSKPQGQTEVRVGELGRRAAGTRDDGWVGDDMRFRAARLTLAGLDQSLWNQSDPSLPAATVRHWGAKVKNTRKDF